MRTRTRTRTFSLLYCTSRTDYCTDCINYAENVMWGRLREIVTEIKAVANTTPLTSFFKTKVKSKIKSKSKVKSKKDKTNPKANA